MRGRASTPKRPQNWTDSAAAPNAGPICWSAIWRPCTTRANLPSIRNGPGTSPRIGECRRHRAAGRRGRWWWLVADGISAGAEPESPNPELNARIAAIISCFPPELFDSTGLLRSLWLLRLTNIAEDTQGMIEALLGWSLRRRNRRRLRWSGRRR